MKPNPLHLLWMMLELPIHRYLMANAYGRASGSEKAHWHAEMCSIYVAAYTGVMPDVARRHHEDLFQAVHTATQTLTDHLDERIDFPLDSPPDYELMTIRFMNEWHKLADAVLKE